MTIGINALTSSEINSMNNQEAVKKEETNSEFQIFDITGNDIQELTNDEIESLISYIGSSKEDKAAACYAKLTEHFQMLMPNTKNLPEEIYNGIIRNELEMLIEDKINENRDSSEKTTLEQYIIDNTKNLKEVQNQQIVYGKDRCDSVTEGELLEMMCGVENSEPGQNLFETAWSWTKNIITLGFNHWVLTNERVD